MGEVVAARVLIRRDLVVHDTLTDPDAPDDTGVQTILGCVAVDQSWTRQICVDVAGALQRGPNTLVFTDRTEHLEALRVELSSRHGLEPAVLKGETGKKLHKAILEGLGTSGTPILLLATGAYLGEGFDLPELDTLFLAFPISGRSRVMQYVGRVTRALGSARTSASPCTSSRPVSWSIRLFQVSCLMALACRTIAVQREVSDEQECPDRTASGARAGRADTYRSSSVEPVNNHIRGYRCS